MRTYLNDVPRTLSNTFSQPSTPLEHHLDPIARGPTPSTFLTRMRLIRGGAPNGGKAGTRGHGGARGWKPQGRPGGRAAGCLGHVCTMPHPFGCSNSAHPPSILPCPPLRVAIPPSILRTGDVTGCVWPSGSPLLSPILLYRGGPQSGHPRWRKIIDSLIQSARGVH